LLPPHEQALFRRLGVFAGGCTLEAAETVANLEAPFDVLEGITALLDVSLLQTREQEAEPRYQMLETIREFALERLIESGEEPTTSDRHARYFRDLAEGSGPRIFRIFAIGDPIQLRVIDRELDNVRAALAWSRETGDHDTLLRLAGALTLFCFYRGYLNEGQRWLEEALQTPPDAAAPWPRAWALTGSGLLANVCGETERAIEMLTASFPWWEQTGDALGRAFADTLLAGVYVSQGRYDEAAELLAANEAYYRDNEAFLRGAGREDFLAFPRYLLGLIAWMQGDNAHARSLLQDAVTLNDRTGLQADAIDSLRYLGLIACAARDLDEAAGWFREEWVRLRQLGNRAAIAVGLADVATLAATREAWQSAVRLFARAEALLEAEGVAFSLPARDHYERAHARAREALGDSAPAVAAAGQALTLEQALTEAEAVLDRDGSAVNTSKSDAEREDTPLTEREQT
jgi:tetratricopeptide (TPR) repeat protein